MELMLTRISRTSSGGNDNIPNRVYRNCTSEQSEIVTRIVNMSVCRGVAPSAWRIAVIMPVPNLIM